MDLENFREICITQCGLHPDRVVLAAFSGGADSLSLALLLHRAGFPVIAAHFNHQLRDCADRDEIEAGLLARRLGITFVSSVGDVPAYIKENRLSVEEGARQLRYRWLLERAREEGAQAVAVGHTADDQIETVLMHLLRGSGIDGLTGMPFRQTLPVWGVDIPIVRPLLSLWRVDTEEICRESGLEPLQDESNTSTVYYRNRIRLELIPYLQTYNPQAKNHILQTSGILSEDQAILDPIKQLSWESCLIEERENVVSFHFSKLKELEEGLRRYVLRQAVARLVPGIRDVDFPLTTRMSDFVRNPTRTGQMHLTSNLWIQNTPDRISIWKGKPGLLLFVPQLEEAASFNLAFPGSLSFPNWELEIMEDDLETARKIIRSGGEQNCVWLDTDRLEFPLEVRSGYAGERLHPFGMKGKSQKLSDFFINHKVPQQARSHWPLVISDQTIVWVVGLGIGEEAAITPGTTRVARLSLRLPALLPDSLV